MNSPFKKSSAYILIILIIPNVFSLSGCNRNNSNTKTDISKSEDIFSKLINYCESNANTKHDSNKKADYYLIEWTDTDSNQTGDVEFSLQIYHNKTMIISGSSMYFYNSGIRVEINYSVKFIYGTQYDNILSYEIAYETLARKLQDQYNYYPYIIDEYKISDTRAKYNLSTNESSCYFETETSKSNIISLKNPNLTLKDISNDCFHQIQSYISNRVNITLFSTT